MNVMPLLERPAGASCERAAGAVDFPYPCHRGQVLSCP